MSLFSSFHFAQLILPYPYKSMVLGGGQQHFTKGVRMRTPFYVDNMKEYL
mgnify:FL=1